LKLLTGTRSERVDLLCARRGGSIPMSHQYCLEELNYWAACMDTMACSGWLARWLVVIAATSRARSPYLLTSHQASNNAMPGGAPRSRSSQRRTRSRSLPGWLHPALYSSINYLKRY